MDLVYTREFLFLDSWQSALLELNAGPGYKQDETMLYYFHRPYSYLL